MKRLFFILMAVCLSVSTAYAQETVFAKDSSQILDMLTSGNGRVFLKIEFDVNSAKISSSAIPVAHALGQALTSGAAAGMNVKLVGHTDSAGKSEYNRKLSLKRAEAVKKYLLADFNISPERISVSGMGEDSPIAPNITAGGRAQNRRVEVINTSKTTPEEKSVPSVTDALFE